MKLLKEMAYNKGYALELIDGQCEEVLNHFLKCLVYENEFNCLSHWYDEIGDYLDYINDIEIKTKTGKISKDEYTKALTAYCGENFRDMNTALKRFKLNNSKKYKTFEINFDLVNKCYTKYTDYVDKLSSVMSIKNNYDSNYFKELTKKFIEGEE